MNPILDIVRTGGSGLTEGHVVSDTDTLVSIGGFAVTAQWVGNILFVLAVALSLRVLRRRDDALAVAFVALTIAVAFFALPTRIHERYLYPAVALAIPFLWTGRPSWRLVFVAVSAVWVAGVSYANENAPVGLSATAQGVFGAMLFGFGSAAGGFLSAILFAKVGGAQMYAIFGALMFVTLMAYLLLDKHLPKVPYA
jgi:MFS family permease